MPINTIMDEQSSKIISLPDMTVAFAALSTLFGNHAILKKQEVDVHDYKHQFERLLRAVEALRRNQQNFKIYHELSQLLSPVFAYFYIQMLLKRHLIQASEFFETFAQSVNCYSDAFLTHIGALKSEEQIRRSKEVSQFLTRRLRLQFSPESAECLVKFLEADNLWLVYVAINSQVFIEQTTVHEVDPKLKGNDSSCQEPKDVRIAKENGNNETEIEHFKLVSAALSKLPPPPPAVRLLTITDNNALPPTAAQLSQSGNFVAVSKTNANTLILPASHLSSRKSALKIELNTLSESVCSLAFAKDDSLLFAASGCDIIYWKIDLTSEQVEKMPLKIAAPPSISSHCPTWTLTVSPLDMFLAGGCHDSTANLFDISNITSVSSLVRIFFDVSPSATTAPVSTLGFHPNCAYLGCGHYDGSIVMWDINDAAPVRRFSTKSPIPIANVKFTPDGVLLLAVDDAGILSTWDLRTATSSPHSTVPTGITRPAACLPVSSDSSLVCVGGLNRLAVLPVLPNSTNPNPVTYQPLRLPKLTVLDADFRLGNILHAVTFKALH